MPAKISTIIFDLDGTLVDTEPAAAHTVDFCFKKWNIKVDPKDATYVTGRTWASALEFLFSKYEIPISRAEATRDILENYRKALETQLILVPGSVAAVQSLATQFPLSLVSGSNRDDILWILDQLKIRQHFQIILGAEDYPKSKPAPDGYLKAIQQMKSQPSSTLVFEDSNAGIASALNAGTWVIAITGTNHYQQDTSRAHAQVSDLIPVTPAWIKEVSKNFIQ